MAGVQMETSTASCIKIHQKKSRDKEKRVCPRANKAHNLLKPSHSSMPVGQRRVTNREEKPPPRWPRISDSADTRICAHRACRESSAFGPGAGRETPVCANFTKRTTSVRRNNLAEVPQEFGGMQLASLSVRVLATLYADQYQKYWSARNLACLQAPAGWESSQRPRWDSPRLYPTLARGSRRGRSAHRPYAMAGGFGALALPSATRPTDVPRVDVGQVDVWHADVRDVDHVWHVRLVERRR